ncbi:MAG: hypothetical protein ABII00_02415 [Elusimicrobiota bacterium]
MVAARGGAAGERLQLSLRGGTSLWLAGGGGIFGLPAEVVEKGRPELSGAGIAEGLDETRRALDKLADYEIDMEALCA